jgi:hypothetical protein
VTFVVALLATTAAALADELYQVRGYDAYQVGTTGDSTHVSYDGSQLLTVSRQGKAARYDAQAHYVREDSDGKTDANARFVQELSPNGGFVDRLDDDPDFLTILNQPFAVQLDPVTMRDLRRLHAAVPFNATSPLGGSAVLHGYLRPGVGGEIGSRRVVAVRFEAQGPMSGPLPGDAKATMSGHMRMDGTAYYALDDALLLALDATLTIEARLQQSDQAVPVRIVYRRYIRAEPRPSEAKKPRPTPLATGGGTGSRSVP